MSLLDYITGSDSTPKHIDVTITDMGRDSLSGFNGNESYRILAALEAAHGSMSSQDIANSTHIPEDKVYRTIKRLVKQGMVSSTEDIKIRREVPNDQDSMW